MSPDDDEPTLPSAGADSVGPRGVRLEKGWGSFPNVSTSVVVSGVGGELGRLAEEIALRAFARAVERPATGGVEPLARAVYEAHEAIVAVAVGEHRGMGATLAALRIVPPLAVIASVGDCRIYRYRPPTDADGAAARPAQGRLSRLTVDDTLWLDEVTKTDIPFDELTKYRPKHQNVIIQGLGVSTPTVHINYTPLAQGDLFLLCSSDIPASLGDRAIRDVLAADGSPSARCRRLIRSAKKAGARDDLTAVLVPYGQAESSVQSPERSR